MELVSIRQTVVSLSMLAMLSGCKASASAKVNDQGVKTNAQWGDEDTKWEGNDETDDNVGAVEGNKRGRKVEGHAWKETGATATLPGFRMFKDGTSRVFIEVSGHVPVAETEAQGKLVYRFAGVRVPERVNTLSLPTLHFETPVTRVSVRRVQNDAELILMMRDQIKPKVHLKRTEMGTVLSVDFPKWTRQTRRDQQVAGDEQQIVSTQAKDASSK